MPIPAEAFALSPGDTGTLQSQIQRQVAEGILSGRFRRGEKLPSSRGLAAHLGISRITVTLAYTELLADDYLTARGRSGYYVSDGAPHPSGILPRTRQDRVDWNRALARRFSDSAALRKPPDWRSYRYPFLYGQADPALFDHANWRLCAVRALGTRDFGALTSDAVDGDDAMLVDYLSHRLLPRRGIRADPDEILITMGAQNALWLTSEVLLNARRTAVIEEPGYPGLRDILGQSRCTVLPVPVDDRGLDAEAIPEGVHTVFVTPSHHCPTGITMPRDRRETLLARAASEDFLIVEDDYEFEMSFAAAPLPALKALDTEGRVIHVGSFSKSLFPGLRLGYLVGSAAFIREARALRLAVLRHPPGHVQRTAAHFLSLGHHDAMVRRVSRALHDRRRVLEQAIAAHGLTRAGGGGAYGGSSLWMRAPGRDTEEAAMRLRSAGVLIEPGGAFFSGARPPRDHYRLAYSSISADRIPEGVARIAAALA